MRNGTGQDAQEGRCGKPRTHKAHRRDCANSISQPCARVMRTCPKAHDVQCPNAINRHKLQPCGNISNQNILNRLFTISRVHVATLKACSMSPTPASTHCDVCAESHVERAQQKPARIAFWIENREILHRFSSCAVTGELICYPQQTVTCDFVRLCCISSALAKR